MRDPRRRIRPADQDESDQVRRLNLYGFNPVIVEVESEKMKIMIVDDNRNIRAHVRRVIGSVTRVKVDLVECADGEEAVQSYSRSPSDLVVMDISMPQKDGITTAAEITAHDHSAKIIFLTLHPVSEYTFLLKNSGVLAVIGKEDVSDLQKELKLFFPT